MSNSSNIRDTLDRLNDDFAQKLLPLMVLIGLLMGFGVAGNAAVCFIFGFRLRMNTQHFLIITLAGIDLFNCLIVMPTDIAYLRYHYSFRNELVCRMMRFANIFYAVSSVLTLEIIAVDRYLKICRPRRRQISMAQARMAVAILLLASFTISSPFMVLFTVKETKTEELGIKAYKCIAKQGKIIIVLCFLLFVAFIISFIALSVIYVCIWRHIKRHNEYMTGIWTTSSNLFSVNQPESSPRALSLASLPEDSLENSSLDGVDNIKDTVLAKLRTGTKARETCPANNRDISNPSTDNRDISTPSMSRSAPTLAAMRGGNTNTDYTPVLLPRARSEGNIDTEHLSVLLPRALSRGNVDTDSISVLEEIDRVNVSLLLTNSSNNETSLQDTEQNSNPALVIQASSLPRIVGRETAVTNAVTCTTLTIPYTNFRHRTLSARSVISEVSTYKTTVIAMFVTITFGISFLPFLGLSLANVIMDESDMDLKGAALKWFHIFVRSHLIGAVCNPIIYGVHNSKFRAQFLQLMPELEVCCK